MRNPLFLSQALIITMLAASPLAYAAPPVPATPPATTTLTIPAPPTLSPAPLFADEVSGRHLLYDTRTAYHLATGVAFTATWTSGQGGIGETVPQGRTGSETFSANAAERKIAVAVTTLAPNGEQEIRRAGCDGTELTTTHFLQPGSEAARRTFARLTLDDTSDLPRALSQIQLDPTTRAAAFTLDARAYVAGVDATVWLAGHAKTPEGTSVAVVDQVESANPNERDRNRLRVCRYWIEPETHRLRRFEIWDVDNDRARPARRTRRKLPNGNVTTSETPAYASTINYRREEYAKVALGDSAPAGPWTLTIPATYEEKPLPAVDLGQQKPLLSADNFDPKARRLLERWRAARERLVSLTTEIDIADRDLPRTAESRVLRGQQQNSDVRDQVAFRRPGKGHFTITTITGGATRRTEPLNGTLIADGQAATWTDTGDDSGRTAPMQNSAAVLQAMQRLIREPFNAINLLLNVPPELENFDKLTYDGQVLIDGRIPVESITFHRNIDRRQGQSETNYTMQVFFATDGMPRWIRIRNQTDLNGRLERDQPPIDTTDIQFVNLALDQEPSSALFVRPKK